MLQIDPLALRHHGAGGLERPALRTATTFTTRDYPANRSARSGEVVQIRTTEYSDRRPVDDILWLHEDYQRLHREAGLHQVRVDRPLALGNEGVEGRSETSIAPWAIYVLRRG